MPEIPHPGLLPKGEGEVKNSSSRFYVYEIKQTL
jgi:hypothetical protein